jgi:hypothetical protein
MHAAEYVTDSERMSTGPRLWSYEALRRAQPLVPLREDRRTEDHSRIGGVWLEHYSPHHGPGFVLIQGPDRREIGRWLYGLAASFDSYRDRYPYRARKIERIFESFVDFDAAGREWRCQAVIRARAASPAARLVARKTQNAAQARRKLALRRLRAFLVLGLERREGERLASEERVWLHLWVRDVRHPKLKVCEQCSLVFAAPRARLCRDCQRARVRITLYPVERGGWHLAYHVGDRWAGTAFDRTVHYTTVCRECDNAFNTTSPLRRLCRNCGGPSGRVRRHRRSSSRTGRQRFRYIAASGEELSAVSMNGVDGHTIHLSAVDGVVQTDDAEVATLLDANSTLKRL